MKFNVIEPFVYPSCLTERQKFPFIKQLVKNTLRQTRNHPKFKDRDTCKTIAHINDMNEGHYRVTIVLLPEVKNIQVINFKLNAWLNTHVIISNHQ